MGNGTGGYSHTHTHTHTSTSNNLSECAISPHCQTSNCTVMRIRHPLLVFHTFFVFGINFPKNYMSVTRNSFLELISRKNTLHVFFCDSENYMEKSFGNYFLGKSHLSYINNAFGVNFAIISGWGVFNIGQRRTKGVENSGEGKTYHKTTPQNGFQLLDPHTYDAFPPPPVCSRPVIFLRGNGHRPDESHFVRLPKLAWRGHSIVHFPPLPQNRTMRFAPPLFCHFPAAPNTFWCS